MHTEININDQCENDKPRGEKAQRRSERTQTRFVAVRRDFQSRSVDAEHFVDECVEHRARSARQRHRPTEQPQNRLRTRLRLTDVARRTTVDQRVILVIGLQDVIRPIEKRRVVRTFSVQNHFRAVIRDDLPRTEAETSRLIQHSRFARDRQTRRRTFGQFKRLVKVSPEFVLGVRRARQPFDLVPDAEESRQIEILLNGQIGQERRRAIRTLRRDQSDDENQ